MTINVVRLCAEHYESERRFNFNNINGTQYIFAMYK